MTPDRLRAALSAVHWQTKHELARALGVPVREFEASVEAIRKAGALAVMSGSQGYKLPETLEEYAANVDRRRRRALSQLVTVRGERRYLRRWQSQGQRTLWEAA